MALVRGNHGIVNYLERLIESDSNDPQMPYIPENDIHSDMARKIMEVMSKTQHWDEHIFGDRLKFDLINQIALHIPPLAGADLDSPCICELVEKAQHIRPDKQAMLSRRQRLIKA
ncbi:hypothetical protein PENVUL_c001G09374 [Penicillium vulpinum]|uniref:Uncharacterized protein n=2 Tax=Penicillium vulpinum TaxID=29845 RepID=A0A1V6SDM7_9EURO|nr:hypothetical protein PENVUL_c001G09374 [Penicillium vulpinum]